jgi:hypothetical protein
MGTESRGGATSGPRGGTFARSRGVRSAASAGVVLAAVVALGATEADGRQAEPLPLHRLTSAIELDGVLDEPAWAEVPPLPFVIHTPDFGAEPSERTEVRVAYDDDFLYVGARLFDGGPSMRRAPSLKRDQTGLSNDWLGVILDTFNDKENGFAFFTNPRGIRTDMAVQNDALGDSPVNSSWNTFWDVAVTQDEEGWTAEFRIPFSSLRFQTDDQGRVIMGLILWRYLNRHNEVQLFPAIPPDWGTYSFFKVSRAREVALEGVQARRPVYVAPYVLGGGTELAILDDGAAAYGRDRGMAREAGLDLKMGVAGNLTLDVTVNTDFAQVEADDRQVNLTRFSLFFPEKRQFFQERASIFEMRTGDSDRVFYSRRVGLHAGVPARVYGGARLVGRIGGWDVGALNMHTAGPDESPAQNFGVVRLRRQVLDPTSFAGGIVTSRIGRDGARNVNVGGDASFRVTGDEYLSLHLVRTFDRVPGPEAVEFEPDANGLEGDLAAAGASGVLGRALARVHWERRSSVGPAYELSWTRIGPGYDPAAGFVARTDRTRLGDRLHYTWLPGPESRLVRHSLTLRGVAFLRNSDGSTESIDVGPEWVFDTRGGHELKAGWLHSVEDLRTPFDLSDEAMVPEGRHAFSVGTASWSTSFSRPLRAVWAAEGGSFYDGRRVTGRVTPTWFASAHLELSGMVEVNRIRFPSRAERYDARVARLRAEARYDTRLSGAALIQHSTVDNAVSANLRLRYNPREGDDLYVVYNHGLNTDRTRVLPHLPRTDQRQLLIKYARTLTLLGER